jgi:predicted MFS family arabinose efflux permease
MNVKSEPYQLTPKMIFLLATAVGVIAANLYYAQPLVAMISKTLGLAPEAAGLVVTLTQMGYGAGVLFIVPLGDIMETKKLALTMLGVALVGLLGLAYSTSIIPYFIAAFFTGLGASTVQIIVPYAAHLSPELKRGQVVGTLMSGLMIGIMLSRPVAGLVTDLLSWHAVFVVSAVLMILIASLLYFFLPPRQPDNLKLNYTGLLSSMFKLYVSTPILRRRANYQALLFGAFCLFWTASPLLLGGPTFNLSHTSIALFALAGVAGAVAAPIAGKASDKGLTKLATLIAMISCSVSFLLPHLIPMGSMTSLALLVLSAILLDAGVTANLVLGQRTIFSLPPEYRSRLNGLYIASTFVGGASGSALGAWAFARNGWTLTSWIGVAMPLVALVYYLTEKKSN